jgi:hypothetical protein
MRRGRPRITNPKYKHLGIAIGDEDKKKLEEFVLTLKEIKSLSSFCILAIRYVCDKILKGEMTEEDLIEGEKVADRVAEVPKD